MVFGTQLPGKPVAYSSGLRSVSHGLLWGIVASFLGYLAFQVVYDVEYVAYDTWYIVHGIER